MSVSAQGTTQFRAVLTGLNEAPPNSDPTVATASLTLQGNSLGFFVDVPADTFIAMTGSINGPALPGEVGPLLFDLGGSTFRPGNDRGVPPGYRFFSPFDGVFGAGPFALTDSQITELENGLWYMNITSAQLPDGQIRGQIVMVPEPCSIALWSLGVGIFYFVSRAKRVQARGSKSSPQ